MEEGEVEMAVPVVFGADDGWIRDVALWGGETCDFPFCRKKHAAQRDLYHSTFWLNEPPFNCALLTT